MGAPAPKTTDGPKDYPRYNFESRVLLWVGLQQHLYYGSFVLAVPIFCMIVEYLGVITKDKALSRKYDQLAYDFVKISLTAYSLTAILGRDCYFYLPHAVPHFLHLSREHLPAGDGDLRAALRSGERHAVHLLLWLGQDAWKDS